MSNKLLLKKFCTEGEKDRFVSRGLGARVEVNLLLGAGGLTVFLG